MGPTGVDELCVVEFARMLQRAVREQYEASIGAEVVHAAGDDANLLAAWEDASPWVREHFIGIARRLAVLHANGVIGASPPVAIPHRGTGHAGCSWAWAGGEGGVWA